MAGKIKIITDSTSDISPARAEELGVAVVPLNVRFGDSNYKDRVDIDRISRRLEEEGVFHFEITLSHAGDAKLSISTFSLDPFKLLNEFIKDNYSSDRNYEGIKRTGIEILKEVFG